MLFKPKRNYGEFNYSQGEMYVKFNNCFTGTIRCLKDLYRLLNEPRESKDMLEITYVSSKVEEDFLRSVIELIQSYREVIENKTFKSSFVQGSTDKAKNDMSKKRYEWANKHRHAVELVTTSGGGFIVGDAKGRSEVLTDMYFFDKNYPTIRDTQKVYDMCIDAGLTSFQIVWVSDIRFWDTHADKFNREFPEHGDDGTDTIMLSTY